MAGDENQNKFEDVKTFLTVVGLIAGGAIAFLKASGIADDFGARYGIAIKDLIWVVSVLAALISGFVFLYYFETVGAGAEQNKSVLRERFKTLREKLAEYSGSDDSYSKRLKIFLGWIDRFFDGNTQPTPPTFVLKEPAHLWTAPAYDRCLALALIYPIAAIFVIWIISGDVGPAEEALGLKHAGGLRRFLSIAAFTLMAFAWWYRPLHKRPRRGTAWLIIGTIGFTIVAVTSTSIVPFVGFFAFTGIGIGPGFGFPTVALAIGFAVASSATGDSFTIFCFVFGILVAGGSVLVAKAIASNSLDARWRAKFLAIFTVIMFLFCLAATRYFSGWQVVGHGGWGDAGPKILFFGLLTLVNAPFDWLSLGLTRFLLRYGIQLGGLWPYALAVVDAVVASALITLLALAMVWLTDLFNYLAEQGGGEKAPILPPMPFYLGMLHKQPFAPEFWWAYATLFSTMIPSVINLSIAGFSFLRGFPPARKFLLSHMREGETMPVITRLIAATILTAQGAAAWTLAIVAQIVLTYVVLWHAMPRLGLGILDLVEKLTF